MRLKAGWIAATLVVAAMTSSAVTAQQAESTDPAPQSTNPEVQSTGPDPQTHDTQINLNLGAKRLVIQTDAGAAIYSNNAAWGQVTAGGITIPAAQTGIIVATFTAESSCSGSPGSWCSIRIVCNGVELQPASGTDFAFDSVGSTSTTVGWKSLSVTRRTNVVGAGFQSCEVQARSVGTATHRVDDWTFMLEYWRQ